MSSSLAIVEDDPLLLDQLVWSLKSEFEIHSASDAQRGLTLTEFDPDLFLLDLGLPPSGEPREGLDLIRAIRQKKPETTIVVMTGETDRRFALEAMELGAFDFFQKPLDKSELLLILRRAAERNKLLQENRALKEEIVGRHSFDELVGASAVMRELFRSIQKVAPSNASILIHGESGTGKELVARSIHRASLRTKGPFVAVNGAALQDTLAESELFGHEKGAFTGAAGTRAGKFELAHRGTLFLDELATLSASVQAKLLRALESREIERLGGTRPIAVDIRLIAATNEELDALIAAGKFREDLFYRLNSVVLRIPPLRERREDIPLLADFFAVRYAKRNGKPRKRFAPATLELFAEHPWRGNVRELEHVVEMLTLMVDEDEVTPDHLPTTFRAGAAVEGNGQALAFPEAVAGFERRLLERAIRNAGGVKAKAARALHLDTNQMKYLCRKYRL
ncbi:MAG TPA: sigma-54 dependent transcriptional regulator [Thermoanaerobaculia bacterium]|jgi:DNA-binding NtrC family response regulator|nr:sigma-54 dependent transcriptional regulator [Thermoanaerobaculia bacterium]